MFFRSIFLGGIEVSGNALFVTTANQNNQIVYSLHRPKEITKENI